ncbi:MAG: helix-turn-helix transcriptional regulator [Actinobacteria bacterium]|nr:helix-turn-helix transcriptional regulator [Actinomycetota bacterium]
MSVGVTVKSARVALSLSTADLAARTKIRESMLVALEADDFNSFGGAAYVRGHLKVLANCLGLDPEGLAAEFDASQRQVSAFERS